MFCIIPDYSISNHDLYNCLIIKLCTQQTDQNMLAFCLRIIYFWRWVVNTDKMTTLVVILTLDYFYYKLNELDQLKKNKYDLSCYVVLMRTWPLCHTPSDDLVFNNIQA